MRGVLYLLLVICLVFVLALSVFNGGITGRAIPPAPIPNPNDPPETPPPQDPVTPPSGATNLQEANLSPLLERFVGVPPGEHLIRIKQFANKKDLKNPEQKNRIIQVTNAHTTIIEDECTNAKTLKQVWVEKYQIKSEEKECESGNCYDGKCLEFSCFDSDGDNIKAGGYVEGIGPEGNIYYREDYCVGDSVREFICVNDLHQHYDAPCEFGCAFGKCKKRIQEYYGFDSDGAYGWFTKGFISGVAKSGEFKIDDECYNDKILIEKYYTGDGEDGEGNTYIGCFYGCEDGACVIPEEGDVQYHSTCLDHQCVKVEGPGKSECSVNEECNGEDGPGLYKAYVVEEEGIKKCELTSEPGKEPCLEDEPTDKVYCVDLEGKSCSSGRCVGQYVETDDEFDDCCVGTCLNPVVAGLNNFLNSFS